MALTPNDKLRTSKDSRSEPMPINPKLLVHIPEPNVSQFPKQRELVVPSLSIANDARYGNKDYFHHDSLNTGLKSIRLITVRKRELDSSEICCDITSLDLGLEPSYFALSYMWGAPNEQKLIFINNAPFIVRETLWQFLKYAQTALHDVKLWIDGLCIDQKNTNERNHQVKMMGDIYSAAERVLVWPWSKSDDGTSILLNRITQNAYGSFVWLPGGRQSYAEDLQILPYWSRTWVAQEIYLAQDISVCSGVGQIAWDRFWEDLRLPGQWLGDLVSSQMYQHRDRRMYIENLGKRSYSKPLLRYLLTLGGCLDVRDRVYSLLSVVQNGEEFVVDYHETCEQLACRAWFHFRQPARVGHDGVDTFLLSRLLSCLEISTYALMAIVSINQDMNPYQQELIAALRAIEGIESKELSGLDSDGARSTPSPKKLIMFETSVTWQGREQSRSRNASESVKAAQRYQGAKLAGEKGMTARTSAFQL